MRRDLVVGRHRAPMAEAAWVQVVDRMVEVAGDARDELGRLDRHSDVVEEQDQRRNAHQRQHDRPVIASEGTNGVPSSGPRTVRRTRTQ